MSGTTVRNLTAVEQEKLGELLGKLNAHVDGCGQCQRSIPPAGMCAAGASLYQCSQLFLDALSIAGAFVFNTDNPS